MSNLKPVGARLVIRYLKEDDRSKIVIPSSYQEKSWDPVLAEVIDIGTGARLENGNIAPMMVKPGDKILVPGKAGYHWRKDGEEYVIINERDVIAIVND